MTFYWLQMIMVQVMGEIPGRGRGGEGGGDRHQKTWDFVLELPGIHGFGQIL